MDRRRLGYDEFISTTDRAFGSFMSDLENSGRLRDTTVLVSAGHGKSFEGVYYSHGDGCQARPVTDIPLIIRTPGQQEGRKVAYVADETALAPTILDLAGQPVPKWMRGQSLAKWLSRDGQEDGKGLAFTQYLERNSVFKPLRHGTVGVIDGEYPYVAELETQKGVLRPLNETHIGDLDSSAEIPERAKALASGDPFAIFRPDSAADVSWHPNRASGENENYLPVPLAMRILSNSSPDFHPTSFAWFAACHPKATPKRAMTASLRKSISGWYSSLGL